MADDNNLGLEDLRHIRGCADEFSEGLDDVKYRLSSVEQQVAGLRANLARYNARPVGPRGYTNAPQATRSETRECPVVLREAWNDYFA